MSLGVLFGRRRPDAAVRLFCFPHAGGSATAYRTLFSYLIPSVDGCAIELPGRGSRTRETFPTQLTTLVRDLAAGLEPYLDRPFALMGYSLGTVIAFELARELRRLRLPAPCHLFVAARQAPHQTSDRGMAMHELPTDQLLRTLEVQYGRSLDPNLAAEPDMVQFFVRIIRADLRLLSSYEYCEEPPLDCPISVLVGGRDHCTSREGGLDWHRHTRGDCRVYRFAERGHFFLDEEASALANIIATRLNLAIDRPAPTPPIEMPH